MGQPAGKRQPIDLDEFERRLRASPGQIDDLREDPLTELARLVGSGPDPFAPLFANSRPATAQAAVRASVAAPAQPSGDFAPLPEPPPSPSIEERVAAERAYYSTQGDGGWAPRAGGPSTPRLARSPRAILLMGGALALVLSGVIATLAMRGHIVQGGPPPIILASSAPVKVRPTHPQRPDPVGRSSAFLNDPDSSKLAPAHVVNTEEEPIDLSQLADQSGNADGAGGANSFLPKPHWVKTVSVRPDGSIISSSAGPAGTPAASPTLSSPDSSGPGSPAADSRIAPPAAPLSSKTKPDARAPNRIMASADAALAPAGVTPAAAPASAASDHALPARKEPARTVAPVQPSPFSAVARMAGSPSPATAPIDLSSRASTRRERAPVREPQVAADGAWAVQLAAPGSERAASLEASRLSKRFAAALDGRKLEYHSAVARGRTVWRVRALGMSESAALALCGKLKASGGACFVAKD